MEDIFAVDDGDVQVISRPRVVQASTDLEEYDIPDSIIAARPSTTKARPRTDDTRRESSGEGGGAGGAGGASDFRFDYLPPRTARTERQASAVAEPFDLGLDNEVVVKTRPAQAKLDVERLCSDTGIPSLRTRAKTFRFKGRGHELADLDKFIEHYQFWCHEMFPKAKFRDCVKMIKKVGRSRQMKVHRRQFINDLLPKPVAEQDDDDIEALDDDGDGEEDPITLHGGKVRSAARSMPADFDMSDFEDADNDPPIMSTRGSAVVVTQQDDVPPLQVYGHEDEDDMDALEAMGYV